MALRKRESRREHNPVRGSSDGSFKKAELLAPPEERARRGPAGQASNNDGVLVVDTTELKLPSDFTEKEEKKFRLFGMETITILILVFSLAFIAFIAYLISTEPPK